MIGKQLRDKKTDLRLRGVEGITNAIKISTQTFRINKIFSIERDEQREIALLCDVNHVT